MPSWWKREPDFIIGAKEDPYLLRWYLIPRNHFFNIYLHKFLRDDDDRALHDHPWISISFSYGEYLELVRSPFPPHEKVIMRRRSFRPVFRNASHAHRIILFKDRDRKPIPFWTLFITGPKVREWGFYCPKGWIPWQRFCDVTDHGNVGRGCG